MAPLVRTSPQGVEVTEWPTQRGQPTGFGQSAVFEIFAEYVEGVVKFALRATTCEIKPLSQTDALCFREGTNVQR